MVISLLVKAVERLRKRWHIIGIQYMDHQMRAAHVIPVDDLVPAPFLIFDRSLVSRGTGDSKLDTSWGDPCQLANRCCDERLALADAKKDIL